MSDVLPVKQLKELIASKQVVIGLQFINDKGAVGTVLDGLSEHGKRHAQMTCVTPNCTELHIREQSDWHQSSLCRTHAKSSRKASSAGSSDADKATKAAHDLERKAAKDAAKAERAAKAKEVQAKLTLENLLKIKAYSAKLNVPVSDVTLRQIKRYEAEQGKLV